MGDGFALLDEIVNGSRRQQAVEDVHAYSATYTGARFERFDHGGDRSAVADTITASDIVAVSTLSIRWPAAAALAVLETHREELTASLSEITQDPIHAVPCNVLLDPEAPSRRACGPSIRSRKSAAPSPGSCSPGNALTSSLSTTSRSTDSSGHRGSTGRSGTSGVAVDERVDSAERFRAEIGGINDISLLRCLDIALWMHATRFARPPNSAAQLNTAIATRTATAVAG